MSSVPYRVLLQAFLLFSQLIYQEVAKKTPLLKGEVLPPASLSQTSASQCKLTGCYLSAWYLKAFITQLCEKILNSYFNVQHVFRRFAMHARNDASLVGIFDGEVDFGEDMSLSSFKRLWTGSWRLLSWWLTWATETFNSQVSHLTGNILLICWQSDLYSKKEVMQLL